MKNSIELLKYADFGYMKHSEQGLDQHISIGIFVKICNFVKVFAQFRAKLLWKSQKYAFGVENTGHEFQTSQFHMILGFVTIYNWNLM